MTAMPPHDPLVAFWQTTPKPDTQRLLEDLHHFNRLHQLQKRSVLAIVCGVATLLIFEEATRRIGSHGILSVLWTLGVVVGAMWHRRARCNRFDTLTLDTVSLLKTTIARAKSDLFVARCLYAGVPCGAAAGLVVAKLVGIGVSARAVNPILDMMQTGAGVAALVIMMVMGVILARSSRRQVQELGEKLRLIEADL